MPFIGQQPTTGAFLELDSLTASATANYDLQLNGAYYYPESVNNLLVSINGVIQGSNTLSLSGYTLTVGATLSASDVIDFVRVFGNVGTISTPTDGSVTANKIASGAVTNAKIADGTLDLTSKVTGVLPLANGGSAFVKLLDQAVSSSGGNYDINNTYINSTYDEYKLIYNVKPDNDNVELLIQFFMTTNASGDAGSIISGNNYAYQNASMASATYKQNNASSYSVMGHVNIGNATGEGINLVGTLVNVNDTTMLTSFSGTGSVVGTSGAHQGFSFHAGMATPATYAAYYCRGIRFYMGGGQHTGRVKLFGIK